MKNKLYIDGIDAFLEYGVFVERQGLCGLIQMPPFKQLDTTEWDEYDGVEVDLSAPVLNNKTFSIKFCITDIRFAEDLFAILSEGAYHTFEFTELGKTYTLRLTSNGSFSSFVRLGKMTLSFADDSPEVPVGEYYRYGTSGIKQVGYEIDGVDFSQFGSYVLKGTDDSLRKAPNTRPNLTISNKATAGVLYDSEHVTFKGKDVSVKMLINVDSIEEFWKRWDSLWAVVLQPESRSFYFAALGHEYECYYKSNTVSKFDILTNGHIWCEFTLTLTFTSCRPIGSYYLLITEDGQYVITEDTENPAKIRIRPKGGFSLLITEDGKYVVTEDDTSQIYFNT